MKFRFYIYEHKIMLLVIIVLLVVECATSIAIPLSVARFVDFGIKHNGITHVSPAEVKKNVHELFLKTLNQEDKDFISKYYSYNEKKSIYELNDLDEELRTSLDEMSLDFYAYLNHLYKHDYLLLRKCIYSNSDDLSENEISQFKEDISNYARKYTDAKLEQDGLTAVSREYDSLGVETDTILYSFFSYELPVVFVYLTLYILASTIGMYLTTKMVTTIAKDLRRRCVLKIMKLNKNQISKLTESSILVRLTNDIQNILNVIYDFTRLCIRSLLIIIICLLYCTSYPIQLNVIFIITIVLLLAVAITVSIVVIPKFSKMQQAIDSVNRSAKETIIGAEYLKSINAFSSQRRKFNASNRSLLSVQIKAYIPAQLCSPLLSLIISFTILSIYYIGSINITWGIVSAGDLIAYVSFMNILISAFIQIGAYIIISPRANVANTRVNEILDIPISNYCEDTNVNSIDNASVPSTSNLNKDLIKFENISLSNEENETEILKSVSFSIKEHKKNFIVGETSSGKTTVINLMLALKKQDSGTINLYGENLESFSRDEMLNYFSYVPQNNILFKGTVKENISLGCDDNINQEKIYDVLETTEMYDFVMATEKKLDYQILQKASNISGGQKQRLCIARSLICDKPIVIMDDCFTALDVSTSTAILNSIDRKYPDTTFVITTNRFDNINPEDNVVILKNKGCIYSGYLKDIEFSNNND